MTSAPSIGVDADVTNTSSLLGCAVAPVILFTTCSSVSTQRVVIGHVRHTSGVNFGRRLLGWGFKSAVECNDAARKVAELGALPTHRLYESTQFHLLGPVADGFGEVNIGIRVGRHRARHFG